MKGGIGMEELRIYTVKEVAELLQGQQDDY